ncbi:CLUMA_CG013790, isoform A [Clunio marinus]|uniref:CLUMA_CG013790, isoform A n=1 Tax=Clunio marinus TaxID=568069 RepID=A0A1J1IPV1_9DIPT|nr:CLUMA_CG013790, isoform A [Clunio marinus]
MCKSKKRNNEGRALQKHVCRYLKVKTVNFKAVLKEIFYLKIEQPAYCYLTSHYVPLTCVMLQDALSRNCDCDKDSKNKKYQQLAMIHDDGRGKPSHDEEHLKLQNVVDEHIKSFMWKNWNIRSEIQI